MPSARKVELELAVLEARRAALKSSEESLCFQHNKSMELDLRLCDLDVFELENARVKPRIIRTRYRNRPETSRDL